MNTMLQTIVLWILVRFQFSTHNRNKTFTSMVRQFWPVGYGSWIIPITLVRPTQYDRGPKVVPSRKIRVHVYVGLYRPTGPCAVVCGLWYAGSRVFDASVAGCHSGSKSLPHRWHVYITAHSLTWRQCHTGGQINHQKGVTRFMYIVSANMI